MWKEEEAWKDIEKIKERGDQPDGSTNMDRTRKQQREPSIRQERYGSRCALHAR